MAPIGGLATGGLVIWGLLSADESIAFAVIFGLIVGSVTFTVLYFGGKLYNKYITPAMFAIGGVDPPTSEPPPWKGNKRKLAWIIYAVLIMFAIWATGRLFTSLLGIWGILVTFIWLAFTVFQFRRIRRKNIAVRDTHESQNHDEKKTQIP